MKNPLIPSLLALSLTLCLALGLGSTTSTFVRAESLSQTTFTATDPALANQHLTTANIALQSGRYQDALTSFDAALQADPTSWLTYYRRATAQLSLGRITAALQDFASLLRINPKFDKAYLQQAKVYLKEGEFEKVRIALKSYDSIRAEKAESSVPAEATSVRTKLSLVETSLKSLDLLVKEVEKAGSNKGKAKEVDSSKVDHCIQLSGEVLKISPSHLETRLVRAKCQSIKGNLEDAMADWTRIVHLSPSPFLFRRLAVLSYFVVSQPGSQSRDAGLQHLKACLHTDPDNNACARTHRKVKALEKSLKKARNFYNSQSYRAVLSALKGGKVGGPTVVDEIKQVIQSSMQVQSGDQESLIPNTYKRNAVEASALLHELYIMYCKSYTELNDMVKAMPYCELVLVQKPDNAEAILARAELALSEEKYEQAVRDLSKAFEASGRTDAKIHQKLQTAQKRLRLSQSKDYYKVLGVKRTDCLATIKKAYRKMARENHPDKGGSQEKMAQINEAWGVLGDEELRKRYDQGDDPNDPMGQAQGGYGNPFAQGGHPFEMFFQQGGGGGGFPAGGFGGFPGSGGGFGGQQFHFKMG
ncbi:related to DnaJ homolog subfamily C member 3 [Melanopsichium pennsylvanicum]|uniref:Tetratricopeptide repeat and J domain-containing co-chaperone DNJ1 n=2 Tax=Melanopsichium pennsylvanicum TaxID=63383 RepID=A0AAJ5C5H4_9BASI|nr:related to DnaJ homolog subfamily C member 3 [Melanopsichium pennsylvanicum 4]SNX84737.1 related to DnaJ homolog subfamily C member 3 [Melanopsichium pennsylvanicum]